MNVYRPNIDPPAPGYLPDGKRAEMISQSLWVDDEIRRAMEFALNMELEDMVLLEKHVKETGAEPLVYVTLELPYICPPVISSGNMDVNNTRLRIFAHEAFLALRARCGEGWSSDWLVAAYGDDNDDSIFRLGLFMTEDFE